MKSYAIYLRKSRADLEAEARGEGETLARHRTALRALARRRRLNVTREYAELVTGDSIAARPQMQQLLDDIKQGLYAGVIVNDVDRLGRGDSIDQEIIKYTLASSHCVIITPMRDIDPANPSDQDMLDFSMFFARFEYRKIAQRLTQGRARSASSGNYISPRVPYGYQKTTDGRDIRLVPDPDTAPVVRMMFDWYASRQCGYRAIADRLNGMGLRTYRGKPFERATVRKMLENPVYTGKIVWGRHVTVTAIEDGRKVKRSIDASPTVAENAHPAIISNEVFNAVQDRIRANRNTSHTRADVTLANPLAGLAYCAVCGQLMFLRGGRKKRLLTCKTRGCPTVGIYVYDVVDAILDQMSEWCATYADPPKSETKPSGETDLLQRQAEQVRSQITKAQELVELGVYTPSEYLTRKQTLESRLEEINRRLTTPTVSPEEALSTAVPTIRRVLEAFPLAQTVEQENDLLKSVISRIEYSKTQAAVKGQNPASFLTVTVYPKLGI